MQKSYCFEISQTKWPLFVCRGRSFPVLSSQKWHQQVIFNSESKPERGREKEGNKPLFLVWISLLQLTVIQLIICNLEWYSTSLLTLLLQVQFGTASVWNANSKFRGLIASHGFSTVSAEGGYDFFSNQYLLWIWATLSRSQFLHFWHWGSFLTCSFLILCSRLKMLINRIVKSLNLYSFLLLKHCQRGPVSWENHIHLLHPVREIGVPQGLFQLLLGNNV